MQLLRDPSFTSPCVLVLGTFDGVHRGHQALLMAGNRLAREKGLPLRVCTFDPHPLETLRPELAPPLLTTLPERSVLMAGFGVDEFCVTTFTREKAAQTPEDFLAEITRDYHPKALVCGFNFTFGAGGRGNSDFLRRWSEENDCTVEIVPAVRLQGDTVSSTRIRGLLAEGNVHAAAGLLGHAFTLSGTVVTGRQIGRTLGFPTANIKVSARKILPKNGVYICCLVTRQGNWAAVANVGLHPTLPGGGPTVEVHVPCAQLELYGEKVRLLFLDFIRPERPFASVEELKAQIAADVQSVQQYFDTEE